MVGGEGPGRIMSNVGYELKDMSGEPLLQGSPLFPVFANLFMELFESELLPSIFLRPHQRCEICNVWRQQNTVWGMVFPETDPFYLIRDNSPIQSLTSVLSRIGFVNIPLVSHPPKSPDFNPIESEWTTMSKYMNQDHTRNRVAAVDNALQAEEIRSGRYTQATTSPTQDCLVKRQPDGLGHPTGSRKPRKAWISEETLKLADKKRKIKNTITTSNNNRDEYRKICNEVRKAARQDKENEEVLSRWTSYCETLYKSNLDDRSRIQELDEISPPLDDTEDLILIDEVRKAIKQLKHHKSPGTDDTQAGFRHDRSTVQQILILRLIAEKAFRKNITIYNCFIDFQKAFDTIDHDTIWAVLRSYGVEPKLIRVLKHVYDSSKAAVRIGNDIGDWFQQEKGLRQGDPISPTIFIVYLERIMEDIQNNTSGFNISGQTINNLRFADDIDLIELDTRSLERSTYIVNREGKRTGLLINADKTKTMAFGTNNNINIKVEDKDIQCVEEFEYLGSLFTSDNDISREIKTRIGKACGAMGGFNKIWNSKVISITTKIQILRTCVFSILLYAAESWTLNKQDRNKLLAFEMNCYRRILNIKWFDRITNISIRDRLKCHETIVQIIIKRKMGLFGHICRKDDDRLVKNTAFGIAEGTNRRGRPRREWLDDIKDWSQSRIASLFHTAQNRANWRTLVKQAVDTNGHWSHGD
ncbi:uncharacterized protein LOC125031667 [Penaeus chinensis]|uniref:uncharacterized protein LOC125031667 n=1 Tax=Penaeus chinensis TaxID=139456 RepID=UPI001FB6BEFC|nr:uncharacterized protein LOC125031667 [Penaeus chinensis]